MAAANMTSSDYKMCTYVSSKPRPEAEYELLLNPLESVNEFTAAFATHATFICRKDYDDGKVATNDSASLSLLKNARRTG